MSVAEIDVTDASALCEGMFTLLRETGNALCFVQMLGVVLTKDSYFNHQIQVRPEPVFFFDFCIFDFATSAVVQDRIKSYIRECGAD